MIERKEALATKAYQRLRDIYLNRDMAAAEWRAKGGRVVLLMGSDVPEEILYAANYLPVSVFSNYGAPTNTELYLEESCDHDVGRACYPKADGRYNFSTGTWDYVLSQCYVTYLRPFAKQVDRCGCTYPLVDFWIRL